MNTPPINVYVNPLSKQPSYNKSMNISSIRSNALQTLKLRKKQIIQRMQHKQSSNSYLQYLMSIKNPSSPPSNSRLQSFLKKQQTTEEFSNPTPEVLSLRKKKESEKKLSNSFILASVRQQNLRKSEHISLVKEFPHEKQIEFFNRRDKHKKLPKIYNTLTHKKKNFNKNHLSERNITNHSGQKKLKKKVFKTQRKQQDRQLMEPSNNILESLVKNINKKAEKRKIETILAVKTYLIQNNQLFRKIPQNLIVYLLKICAFHRYSPGSVIYHTKDDKKQVFIVLEGVIHFSNFILQTKKLGFSGTIFGQEMVLTNSPAIESVRSVTKCIAICLSKQQYQTIQSQAHRLNSTQFANFDKLIKSSYETKIKERNQQIFSGSHTKE